MPDPAVSVVIPSYNRFSFLVQAIESVLRQSFENWELVVVDDGSTDETRDFLNSMRDPRVRSVRQENAGVSSARNRGVYESQAEHIAFLDSDDLWLPRKLGVQLDFFGRNPQAAICQTEEIWERRGRRVNPRLRHAKKSGRIFCDCLPLCIVSPSAVMMRRCAFDELGGFDESLPACEDYDLWLRAALRYEIHTIR
nr:glycosyltransferase [bacterium]